MQHFQWDCFLQIASRSTEEKQCLVERHRLFHILSQQGLTIIIFTPHKSRQNERGAWVAVLVKCPTLDFSSGHHHLTVGELESCVRLLCRALCWQLRACVVFSLFLLSLPLPCTCMLFISQKNKHLKTTTTTTTNPEWDMLTSLEQCFLLFVEELSWHCNFVRIRYSFAISQNFIFISIQIGQLGLQKL